jgi:hypothetical protein
MASVWAYSRAAISGNRSSSRRTVSLRPGRVSRVSSAGCSGRRGPHRSGHRRSSRNLPARVHVRDSLMRFPMTSTSTSASHWRSAIRNAAYSGRGSRIQRYIVAGPMPANRAAGSRKLPARMAMKYRPTTSGFSLDGRPGRRRLDPPAPSPGGAHSGSRRAYSAQRYMSAARRRGGRWGRLWAERGFPRGWAWLLTEESCAIVGPQAGCVQNGRQLPSRAKDQSEYCHR